MRLLKSLFKSERSDSTKNQIANFPWKALNEINQIEKLVADSNKKTIVIFKHSTTCGISRAVLKKFEKQTQIKSDVDYYYLDLLSYREISNKIASHLEVVHQSPQLIVVRNGAVIAHDSHYHLLDISI